MKRTPPVRGQAYRIEAHLAARAGERARAIECWTGAQELTSGCGMAFETAVLALERAEQQRSVRPLGTTGLPAPARLLFDGPLSGRHGL